MPRFFIRDVFFAAERAQTVIFREYPSRSIYAYRCRGATFALLRRESKKLKEKSRVIIRTTKKSSLPSRFETSDSWDNSIINERTNEWKAGTATFIIEEVGKNEVGKRIVEKKKSIDVTTLLFNPRNRNSFLSPLPLFSTGTKRNCFLEKHLRLPRTIPLSDVGPVSWIKRGKKGRRRRRRTRGFKT